MPYLHSRLHDALEGRYRIECELGRGGAGVGHRDVKPENILVRAELGALTPAPS